MATKIHYRAAMRDASWYRYPGRAGRYHVLRGTNEHGSLESYVADTESRCGIPVTVNDYETLAICDVPYSLRCRRRGCREIFEAEG